MRWKVFLALLALALHALAPLRAGASPQLVELCTAHGVVTVQLDGGDGVPASPAAEHCSICVFQSANAAPLHALPVLQVATAGRPSLKLQPAVSVPPRTASRPRAPPIAS